MPCNLQGRYTERRKVQIGAVNINEMRSQAHTRRKDTCDAQNDVKKVQAGTGPQGGEGSSPPPPKRSEVQLCTVELMLVPSAVPMPGGKKRPTCRRVPSIQENPSPQATGEEKLHTPATGPRLSGALSSAAQGPAQGCSALRGATRRRMACTCRDVRMWNVCMYECPNVRMYECGSHRGKSSPPAVARVRTSVGLRFPESAERPGFFERPRASYTHYSERPKCPCQSSKPRLPGPGPMGHGHLWARSLKV